MTDGQQLFAEYVKAGSEPAFHELVTRYVGLVYSAAVRLVDGDTHMAKDITQMVFADLARMAGTLSTKTMLGGTPELLFGGPGGSGNREMSSASFNGTGMSGGGGGGFGGSFSSQTRRSSTNAPGSSVP